MAHDFYKRDDGSVDIQHWSDVNHSGPECKICGMRFCFNCTPQLLETDCSDFKKMK